VHEDPLFSKRRARKIKDLNPRKCVVGPVANDDTTLAGFEVANKKLWESHDIAESV